MTSTDSPRADPADEDLATLFALIAGVGRLETVVPVDDDQWVVTGEFPYDGTVMLARYPSYEKALAVLAAARNL